MKSSTSIIAVIGFLLFSFFVVEYNCNAVPPDKLNFCLFNKLPLSNNEVANLLQKHIPVTNSQKLYTEGYSFPISDLKKDVHLANTGFIAISKDNIIFDQISKLNFLGQSLYFKGTNFIIDPRDNTFFDYDYLIDIDQNFLKNHQVISNHLQEFTDAAVSTTILSRTVAYFQQNYTKKRLPQVSLNNNGTVDFQREIANHFTLQLFQVQNYPYLKFYIAVFELKNQSEMPLASFAAFVVNNQIVELGNYDRFTCFSIDNQCYLGCFCYAPPHSGNWGKLLFTLKNGQLTTVAYDSSFAD